MAFMRGVMSELLLTPSCERRHFAVVCALMPAETTLNFTTEHTPVARLEVPTCPTCLIDTDPC